MTGVAAIFDLYTSFQESRKDVKTENEEPKLEPDPEEFMEGCIDEKSAWHCVIENHSWDDLLEMI